jgi:hypothetical protein
MTRAGKPWRVGLLAAVLFGLLGTGAAYYGIQDARPAADRPAEKPDAAAVFVTRIELPADDTPIPDGPHQGEFRVACTVCHSARLVFTQPPLTDGQWSKVVQKMTAKYGAPLSSDEEKRIVQYLHAVHGK